MNSKYANYLLKKTKDDYNRMTPKFSSTRKFLSPDILALKKYARGNVLDLGCGNGRLFEMFSDSTSTISYMGADISEELLKMAKKNYSKAKFIQLQDSIELPFENQQFDTVYSLAVFHHIPSARLRRQYLSEIRRAMKQSGTLVMTVWNLIERSDIRKQLFVNNLLSFFRLSKLDKDDTFYNFKEGKNLLAKRYLHCFTKKELERLLQESGSDIIESAIVRRGKSGRFSNALIIARAGN